MRRLKVRRFSNLPKVTGIEKDGTGMETQAYISTHPLLCLSKDVHKLR